MLDRQPMPKSALLADGDCLDVEIYLSDHDQASLRLGGTEYPGRPQLDAACLAEVRAAPDLREAGRRLFDALLPVDSDLRAGYRLALATARDHGQRLRLRLHLPPTAPHDLHEVPWEVLYDPREDFAFGWSRDLLLSRYLSLTLPAAEPVTRRPRLLVAVANPADLGELRLAPLEREVVRQQLENALAPLAGRLDWDLLEGPTTAEAIRRTLTGGDYHALHLMAHGRLLQDHASLVLEGEDGRAAFVDEQEFSEIFQGLGELRLITLMACHGGALSGAAPFSGLARALVRRGVPAVVALRQAMTLAGAERFCHAFYGVLADDGDVDLAVNEARQRLRLADRDSDEWALPVLFLRQRQARLWSAGAAKLQRPALRVAAERGSEEVWWPVLLEQIEADRLLPFVGPGLLEGLLPLRAEIARRWLERYPDYPLVRPAPLPTVAQYLTTRGGLGFPHSRLGRLLEEDLAGPSGSQGSALDQLVDRRLRDGSGNGLGGPHQLLASLGLSYYVTTNFDGFLAAALRQAGRRPREHCCRWRGQPARLQDVEAYQGLEGSRDEPLVFHLYGLAADPSSLVLTEDDLLDFLYAIAAEPERIPRFLLSRANESMLIFLGYDVRDLACRVLLRGLVAQLRQVAQERIAVLQMDPQEDSEEHRQALLHFQHQCHDQLRIKVYRGSVKEFLSELRQRREVQP